MEKLIRNKFEQSYTMHVVDSDIEMLSGTSADVQAAANMFDRLDALPIPQSSDHHTELDCYLTADIEHVTDAIAWWHEHHTIYPCLSRMALDYLSVPGVHCIASRIISFIDIHH